MVFTRRNIISYFLGNLFINTQNHQTLAYITLLRPQQWCKNLFIFLPIFFAQAITDYNRLLACVIAFVAMCMISSSIYILNDICDRDYDRLHPVKSQRPIASGRVPLPGAWCMYTFLLILAVALVTAFIPKQSLIVTFLIYWVLNHAYSLWLKHIALLDVMIVAIGFVLRILVGAFAADVTPSHWIIIMTYLLALFLVLAKRRDDVIKYEQSQTSLRRNVQYYNRAFLDNAITLVAAVTLVSYIMYTVDDAIIERFDCHYVYATAIFVLAGLLRYLQLTIVEENSGSPTKIIIRDRFMRLCVIGWILLFAFIIYG